MMTPKDVDIRKELKHLRFEGKPAYLIRKPEYQITVDMETIQKLKFVAHELDGNNNKTYAGIIQVLIKFYLDKNNH